MSVSNLASCTAVLGKSGSGKSTIVKRKLRKEKPTRLAIWSPDEDQDKYGEFGVVVRTIPALIAEMKKKTFRVVFWPSMNETKRAKEFDYFCKLAFAAKKMTVLVEELYYVTSPTHSPEPWSILSLRGRKMTIKVIGTSQRPAHIDKNFLGNTSEIFALAMKYPRDRKAVAEAMDIDVDLITKLKPLEWIRVADNEPMTTGTLTF